MTKIKIITDSTCDLNQELIKKYDIEVIPLIINIGDESYLDGVDIDIKTLLHKMDVENASASTSQIIPGRFHEVYKKYVSEGYSIISIHLSSEMSGTYHSACLAKESFENADINIIDSRNVTSGLGLLVLKAAKLAEEGKTAKEIVSIIEELKPRVKSLLGFESLDNLVRGGRLSKTAGIIGSMLGIKVVLGVVDGNMAVKEKFRGSKKAIKYIIENFEKSGYIPGEPVMLLSIENKDIYEPLKQYLVSNNIEYIDNQVGCTVGIHSGPKACGIFFLS
ncbi:DegV family protein [Clostridium polynesiense]|uniref:DegV family protein n=1 Tax=Clostridium polynesiense TaxID=1325933 RepID=UPI00058EF998|nr:DegV family protein [Clostridium polynesiense]